MTEDEELPTPVHYLLAFMKSLELAGMEGFIDLSIPEEAFDHVVRIADEEFDAGVGKDRCMHIKNQKGTIILLLRPWPLGIGTEVSTRQTQHINIKGLN